MASCASFTSVCRDGQGYLAPLCEAFRKEPEAVTAPVEVVTGRLVSGAESWVCGMLSHYSALSEFLKHRIGLR